MKNKVQFQKGFSLGELLKSYGTEEQCRNALFKWRWPQGYVCPECGARSYCALKTRAVYQCNRCHHQHSLISGTIFSATKLPLTTWYLDIHLLTQAKPDCRRYRYASNWVFPTTPLGASNRS